MDSRICQTFTASPAERRISQRIRAVLSRYIEIHRKLLSLPPGPERTRLVSEASSLKK